MAVKRFLILKDIYHKPLDDKSYVKGSTDKLAGWKKKDIQSAIKAGLIRELENGKDNS